MPSVPNQAPPPRLASAFGTAARYLFITITLAVPLNTHLHAQQLTTQAPPQYPAARPFIVPPPDTAPTFESHTQAYAAGIITLDGEVEIHFRDHLIRADHIVYDTTTHEATATGHLDLSGGTNDEHILATRGTYNLDTATGTFYDVSGSVGVKNNASARRTVYTTANPFRFTGRILEKTGPAHYDIYDGSVTSCQLPKPDWLFSASHFAVADDKAHAAYATFRLLNIPILFLPYITAPTDLSDRQSGFTIPTISNSSIKGIVLGEEFYLVLGRSADLTVGADYYSSVGWAQHATFRAQGRALDFARVHYDGVLDRRAAPNNQGGEEVTLAGRHDFTPNTRVATNIDYLSSYIYREAFTDTFNQAVTSDIVSTAFATRATNGIELSALADRYQGIKTLSQAPTAANPVGVPQQEVHIFHAPTLGFDTTDLRLGRTGLQFSLESSASGLKRSQNNFVTGGIVERFDLHPQLAFPIHLSQWNILPTLALRETLYTRSRATTAPGQPPAQSSASLSRADIEFAFTIRPPTLERTFTPPANLTRIFGEELRHTLEPELTYRLTDGVDNFAHVLRFDATDVVANTDELEYGITQRLFRKRTHRGPCATAQVAAEPGLSSNPAFDEAPAAALTSAPSTAPCTVNESLISWRLTQKYFFDETFGGAIVDGRRNIFDTTLNLSGVAFLTEPRAISPLISRLRVRTSAHTDIEWDFDLDTGAKKFTSSNVFVDLHQGQYFSALSYARLDAPGRFYTQNPTPTTSSPDGITSQVSDFNQLRVLLGYGNPGKPGLSLAGNAGIDLKSLYGATTNVTTHGVTTSTTVYPALLQYAAVQTSYNWNCCGVAIEYRKFELGSVRNEGTYRFSFTLANIGTAGNLRRAERLF